MTEKDIVVEYVVSRYTESKQKVNIESIIKIIIHYVQNNEVSFKKDPVFIKGHLVFQIAGSKEDHGKIQDILKSALEINSATLAWSK